MTFSNQCNGPADLIWREFLAELQTLPRFGEVFLQAAVYLRLWSWFNFCLCHFNFSWAVFTACFHKFWTLWLCRGKLVKNQLFVYFLNFKTIYALHFIDIFTVPKNQSNQALFSWNFCGMFIKLQHRWRKLSCIFCRLKRWKNNKADKM